MERSEKEMRQNCWAILEDVKEYARQIDAGADEPAVRGVPIWEYQYAVVAEVGQEWGVQLAGGGPEIWVLADGDKAARLEGFWGGDHVVVHDRALDVFLDYQTGRDAGDWHPCLEGCCQQRRAA